MLALLLVPQFLAPVSHKPSRKHIGDCEYEFSHGDLKLYYKGKIVWQRGSYPFAIVENKPSHQFFFLDLFASGLAFSYKGKLLYSMNGGPRDPCPFFISDRGVVVYGVGNTEYTGRSSNLAGITWHSEHQHYFVRDARSRRFSLPSLKVAGIPFFANNRFAWSLRPQNWATAMADNEPADFWLVKYDLRSKALSKYSFRLPESLRSQAADILFGSGPVVCTYDEKRRVITRKWAVGQSTRLQMPKLGGL